MGQMEVNARRERVAKLFAKNTRRFADVPAMSVEEAMRRMREGNLVLVDTRSPTEQAVSVAEGAVTLEAFEAGHDAHAGKAVVTYCTVGFRSGLAAQQLRRGGWEAYNLEGAILGWVHGGGRLVDANGPTTRVHTWSGGFDLLPEGYQAVW